ncbi:MAG: mechanosensitive ion channel domain-containing protein [Nostoc sp. EfeVER01]|uniref:mechanosensitive ion channel family protein n=1 Tax=unclassified Nostoc TaxID=2593658 RepID=UPI002AD25BC0|nr:MULTISPECIES: mechanosensitive ion channel family protein [unclassified Nostoc]MDZ7943703.1 mechanosensitive ion channel family protein [Nostoc sp. EfeVER01]MDZ7991710.1 mechanosensitive ion channel family protein [Nostoc sp. EspVER01]
MVILSFNRLQRLTIRFVLIIVVTIAMVFGWGAIAHSQLASSPTAASNDPHKPPKGVTRLGEYEIANVNSPLDKNLLFKVVSPTVFNRDQPPEGSLPVEVRAEEITQRLMRALDRADKAKETPIISVATLNNRLILQLNDDQTTRSLRLVTVTEPDADYYGKTLEELSQEWQKILQAEVERIERLFSPKVLSQRVGQAIQISIGLVLGSVVLWFLRRTLIRKQTILQARYQEHMAEAKEAAVKRSQAETSANIQAIDTSEPEAHTIAHQRSQFLKIIQRQFTLKRQLGIYSFLTLLLFWAFILVWYIGIVVIMSRVPYLMRWWSDALARPLALLIIWFFISVVIRIGKSLIDYITDVWTTHPSLPLSETQRIALRAATVSGALKGLIAFVFITFGILRTLDIFNVPTSSILAGGAVIGIAISLGSQSLMKDLVNGCLILMEDQFAVGDVIEIGNKSGLVENLNLRVTQLRNGEGQLITIPNSNITDVNNLTRLWSRVDFSIVVAYENDPKYVLEILRQVSQELYNEPEWRDRLPELPEVLGIDDLSHTGMLVRVWIKTAPMEQWNVGREFRLRVRLAFEANNIQIGRPQRISYNTDLG